MEGEAPAEPNFEFPTRLARRLALQVTDGPTVEREAPRRAAADTEVRPPAKRGHKSISTALGGTLFVAQFLQERLQAVNPD